MSDKKIIAVVGRPAPRAAGWCAPILADKNGPFRARALTRDVNSEKAKALAAAGAEVVAADVDDPATLRRAFEGAHGAFCVTFFWEHFSPEKEIAEAGSMAEAAKQAGVAHVIWSTLEDTRRFVPLDDDRMPTLHGEVQGPPLRRQGRGRRALHPGRRARPPSCSPRSTGTTSSTSASGPKRGPDGKLALVLPMGDKKLPGIAAEDIGKCAYGIFKRGRDSSARRWASRGST